MHVQERTGQSLRGIHIVRKTGDGSLETVDAEKGRISQGTDSRVMRITLYDVHGVTGAKQRFTAKEMPMDLTKKLDLDSLEKIGRDVRRQRLTNQIQPTGR